MSEEMTLIHRQHDSVVAILATNAEFVQNVSHTGDRIAPCI